MTSEAIHTDDLRVATFQLGRSPRGVDEIAVRCPYGFPQVLGVHPVVDGAPFPTTFWLSCPHLSRAVDRLEAAGWISDLEARLRGEPALTAAYAAAHREAIRERELRLRDDERAALERRGQLDSLLATGLGGIADRTRVKCLHLHVAHALARENPIGRLVLERIPERACPTHQVICSAA